MRQFFPSLNVSHGHKYNLPLDADIRVTRVIAEDHPALSLVFRQGANEEPLGHEDFRGSKGRRDSLTGGVVKDVATFNRHNLVFHNGGDGKESPSMDGTLSDKSFGR